MQPQLPSILFSSLKTQNALLLYSLAAIFLLFLHFTFFTKIFLLLVTLPALSVQHPELSDNRDRMGQRQLDRYARENNRLEAGPWIIPDRSRVSITRSSRTGVRNKSFNGSRTRFEKRLLWMENCKVPLEDVIETCIEVPLDDVMDN